MKRPLFTVAILPAAFVLYSVGMVTGASVFFAVGAACELWFWARLLGRSEGPNISSNRTREKPRAA